MNRDVNILAATLFAESDPGNDVDALAIAQVVMNRVAQPSWWGDSISAVCLSPHQFSCWNWWVKELRGETLTPGDEKNKTRISRLFIGDPPRGVLDHNDSPWFATCQRIAQRVAKKGGDKFGANHYYASYIPTPLWARGLEPVFRTEFKNPVNGRAAGHIFFHLNAKGTSLMTAVKETPVAPGVANKFALALGAFIAAKLSGFDFLDGVFDQEDYDSIAIAALAAVGALWDRWNLRKERKALALTAQGAADV